jgi:hypothetical protein
MAMATRYLVTQPSYIGDTLVYPGHTIDAGADFISSPHLVAQPAVALPSDDTYTATVAAPPPALRPTVSVVKPPKAKH